MAHICLGGVVVVGWGWGGDGMVGWMGLELTDTLVGSCISQSKHANLIYYVYFCALVYILHYSYANFYLLGSILLCCHF